MHYVLYFMFLFFEGSIFGYFLELIYRRIKHKKWVNPGFLIGPYLPIYGFGLCTLTLIYLLFMEFNVDSFVVILLMGFCMTLIEFLAGFLFFKIGGIKLWDYSDVKWNYKGIVCPRFAIIWTLLGAIYYYFVADKVIILLKWFESNMSFSFVLGIFFGLIIIDLIYSTNTFVNIRKFVKENNFVVKYEEFKKFIKDFQEGNKEKYSFLFPFRQSKSLRDYLNYYKNNKFKKRKRNILNLLKRK